MLLSHATLRLNPCEFTYGWGQAKEGSQPPSSSSKASFPISGKKRRRKKYIRGKPCALLRQYVLVQYFRTSSKDVNGNANQLDQ